MKKVMEASDAVATAVKMCGPAVIPMYPITPQTHIVEKLASMINDAELDSEMIPVESEHSAISAALGASAIGVRVFTATSSQGLALMHEVLFITSGMRLPVVMAVANRTLSAPINIWNDQQDSISERDSGWLQFYVESAQEAFDTVIMAYKIAEDKKVLLPAMVCLDGFTLSHVFEPVEIPEQKKIDKFLPNYKPIYKLEPKKPMSFGPIAYPDTFMGFKKMQQDAMQQSIQIIKKVHTGFKKSFGRSYGDGLVETYKTEDAEYAIVAMGSVCGTIRTIIDEMRKQGKKYGMIKIRAFRPFPEKELLKVSEKLKALAVLDRNTSLGNYGALYTEMKAVCKGAIRINGFIAGLGGKDITPQDIKEMFELSEKNELSEKWIL